MNRDELKFFFKNFELFSLRGKLNPNKLKTIPPEVQKEIFNATSNCQSDKIHDRIYWIIHDIFDYRICKTCNQQIIKHIKNFASTVHSQEYCNVHCRMTSKEFHDQMKQARIKKTGFSNPLKDPAIKQKLKETNLKRYGVENTFAAAEIKEKIKATSLERYGLENPTTTEKSKLSRKNTLLKKYGVDNPRKILSSKEKSKLTCLEKYGVEYVGQSEEIKKKIRDTNLKRYGMIHPSHTEKGAETCIKKYGVRHHMQDIEVFKRVMKSRFKKKPYITRSGTVLQYQGYENVALDFLFNELKLNDDEVIIEKHLIPTIFYFHPLKNKKSRYYVDIWIPSLNLMIEVKSEFTMSYQQEVTLEKQTECKRQGYNHLIFICDKKNILYIYD